MRGREEERVNRKLQPVIQQVELSPSKYLDVDELSEEEALESNRKLLSHEISPRKRELVISA